MLIYGFDHFFTRKNIRTMSDTIRTLKEQCGANSPAVAEQLNSIAIDLQSRGDTRTALKFHQEALTILEWNKCNALMYDFVKKSKGYAIDMARTLCKIGNLLREMNNFVGAAEVYKECLDTFLEGLIEGGGALKRQLLECEYKKHGDSYHAILDRVDRKTTGRILCLNPDFRAAVRDISQLFREMQCVKFVGQNAASSRRRRRMVQHAAMEENLKNAVESLNMSTSADSERKISCNDEELEQPKILTRTISLSSTASGTSDNDAWMKGFYEKEMGRFSRPRPLSRRAITSDEENAHYKALSSMIVPAEQSLVIALNRFPLPSSVVGHHIILSQSSKDSLQESIGLTGKNSIKRSGPPHHQTSSPALSPQCVTRVFLEDNMFQP